MSNTDTELLQATLHTTERESSHLLAVSQRLFSDRELDREWLQATLDTPEGIDRLESFNGKFSRLQDAIMDKLLPRLLRASGELTGSAIDNLNKAEQIGLLDDTERWISIRRVRNMLVHEYFDDPGDMLDALLAARDFSRVLIDCHQAIAYYAREKLGVSL